MKTKIEVGILAATGSVGQRFVQLLDGHPWFEVVKLSASDKSVGQKYSDACHWLLPTPMPLWAREMIILPASPVEMNLPVIFSALPADVAREVEPQFALQGASVFSNASAYRYEDDVPILLPEVNPDHISIIDHQRNKRGWKGFIVTNSNCTSAGLSVTLQAIHSTYGINRVFVVSLQAISGAGYPGVSSMDILDNVIPYIAGEEDKVEAETKKILGRINYSKIIPASFKVSAHCNRVNVSDGHVVCASIEMIKKDDIQNVISNLRDYKPAEECSALPSTPSPVIQVCMENDRPQPRMDRMNGRGMTTLVGRVRPDPLFDIKLIILSHNTIRGAAGGSIYNAELMLSKGYIGG